MAQAYLKGLRLVILANNEENEEILRKMRELFEVEVEYIGRCG
ncbi:MAG: hypothetical protein QXQ38_00685 [Archaeoglobaceae archaeon]